MKRRTYVSIILTFALSATAACAAFAQATVDLHVFQPKGIEPRAGLVLGSDGDYYGTTNEGGAYDEGTVFKITPAGVLSVLYTFKGDADGASPSASMVEGSDGNFYGTTEGGGTGWGAVFQITPSGVITTLHEFDQSDGWDPFSSVIFGTDGNLYGTTLYGGTSDAGTVFEVTTSGTFTSLYSFSGPDGAEPSGGLVRGSEGNLFGVTQHGGATGDTVNTGFGTVFQITTAGALTSLHSFNGTDGMNPWAALAIGPGGNLYGTTVTGGSTYVDSNNTGDGTVFKITSGGSFTSLHSFDGSDGFYISGGLVLASDGNFYGTTWYGGADNDGTVYQITPEGALTTVYTFTGLTDGHQPKSTLVQGADGSFFGVTTPNGPASGDSGTVFNVTSAGTLSTLYAFAGSDGSVPYAGVTQGTDGNYYGVTTKGGDCGLGTVFQMTPAGSTTVLHSFCGADGNDPLGALVQGTDGNFYGTTVTGGVFNNGATYSITPGGVFTTLHSFHAEGAYPNDTLIQANDGNFYGTSYYGGTNNDGIVFQMTPAGTVTILHSFSTAEGGNPIGGVIQGTDGSLYGTTSGKSVSNDGSVFKVDLAGDFTLLYSFSGVDGSNPYNGLTEGADGNFYGTTQSGGLFSQGEAFQITPTGTLTVLHSFNNTDGSTPFAGLTQGSDGDFYGVTEYNPSSAGVIFKVTASSGFTLLHSFLDTDGLQPTGTLIQGSDGNFYGTTQYGGVDEAGVVFAYVLQPAAPLTPVAVAGNHQVALSWTSVLGATSYNIYRGTTAGGEDVVPVAAGVTATTFTNTGLTAGTTYYYTIAAVNAGGTSASSAEVHATPFTTGILPPRIAYRAAAVPLVVTGTTTNLAVRGSSAGGESSLIYAWSARGPATVTFSATGTNAAKNATATFAQSGIYTITATVTDSLKQSVTSSVQVTVRQTAMQVVVSPNPATVSVNSTQAFTATVDDQFGVAFSPTVKWSLSRPSVGSIDSTGNYSSGPHAGSATVIATVGPIRGQASVTVSN